MWHSLPKKVSTQWRLPPAAAARGRQEAACCSTTRMLGGNVPPSVSRRLFLSGTSARQRQ